MTSATYAGTTGHSGTDTSRAQADPAKHEHVQAWVLEQAARAGRDGVTVAFLRLGTFAHHGSVSSALTNLHRDGRLARLVDKRDRCHIYVLPEHVGDRDTEPPTMRTGTFVPTDEQARLNELARQEGHDLGWSEGEQRGRADAATAVIQHIDAMRSAMGPGSAGTHDDRCWQRHVRCALTAVRSTAIRARGEGPA